MDLGTHSDQFADAVESNGKARTCSDVHPTLRDERDVTCDTLAITDRIAVRYVCHAVCSVGDVCFVPTRCVVARSPDEELPANEFELAAQLAHIVHVPRA